MKQKSIDRLIFLILLLGLISLFLEYGVHPTPLVRIFVNILDFAVIILFTLETVLRFSTASDKKSFVGDNIFDLMLLVILIVLFTYTKYTAFLMHSQKLQQFSTKIIMIRNIFSILKIFGRVKKLNYFLKSISSRPAQTIAFSFLVVILIGTILLMLPFAIADGYRLGIINALFTATSAVCVTGLIVVDTATKFTLYGKIVIMLLIQVGGLGIMILSYFSAVMIGKRISIEEKLAMSYLINEQDMHKISRTIVKIILVTFAIELVGAMLLFAKLQQSMGVSPHTMLFSVFHSISAFCNAGFALYTDSLEGFKSSILVNFIIAGLIILGGISFAVIFNLTDVYRKRSRIRLFNGGRRLARLNLNTKAVLIVTGILIFSGMLLIYGLEHRGNLVQYGLKTQYLSAFFQSVTLRTAGFNTIPISQLKVASLLLMVLFMFIGGASGSTAGGIKVNTVFVIFAYIKSTLSGKSETTALKNTIPRDLINKSFMLAILALLAVFSGTFILSISEHFSLDKILFEVVSAFGTVGLSTGITGLLSGVGKITIIILMFIGRIGPLTLIAALSRKSKQYEVKYPEESMQIG
jgi:trk system potassium uptake protein TrkH